MFESMDKHGMQRSGCPDTVHRRTYRSRRNRPVSTSSSFNIANAYSPDDVVSLVSKRSLTYQWQTINTMYHRAKHHPNKTSDMEAAMAIFKTWLDTTYPQQKADQRTFKPLSKKTVEVLLPELKKAEEGGGVDTAFAELYVHLEPRKRLANVLVNPGEPGEPDWEKTRLDALSKLVPEDSTDVDEETLWGEDGLPSPFHWSLIAWAWSPLSDQKLLKAFNKAV